MSEPCQPCQRLVDTGYCLEVSHHWQWPCTCCSWRHVCSVFLSWSNGFYRTLMQQLCTLYQAALEEGEKNLSESRWLEWVPIQKNNKKTGILKSHCFIHIHRHLSFQRTDDIISSADSLYPAFEPHSPDTLRSFEGLILFPFANPWLVIQKRFWCTLTPLGADVHGCMAACTISFP